jgi:hypothetical protein
MKKKKLYLSRKLSSWKEPYKIIKRKNQSILQSLRKKSKIINPGPEMFSLNMNNKSGS